MALRLYRPIELAFRTQYAELKERTLAAGTLLPGTPGSLALRRGTGHRYWYRVSYPVPGRSRDEWVCKDGDDAALAAMRERIEHHEWVVRQVSALRKLGFQVADKQVARVLVELHNLGAFEAGMVLVGTLAWMAWLNELGGIVVGARTQDIDLARGQPLKLAAPLSFLAAMKATDLPFAAVPGMPSTAHATSVKLPGVQGLRVDMLTHGEVLGRPVALPELQWFAQTVPHYDYLLADAEPGAMLAGGHCIPVRLPQAGRLVWHKLYASTQRKGFPEKAVKDREQALALGALIADSEPHLLEQAFHDAPEAMTSAVGLIAGKLASAAAAHPELADMLASCKRS